MREVIVTFCGVLACAGCVAAPMPEPVISQITSRVAADDPRCQQYTARATINGLEQDIAGRACQQPDGSWRVAEGPPEQPDKYVIVYAPPAYSGYPAYDPWLWGPPIGISLGALVFVDRDHRFHEFHHLHHFAFGGFRDGAFHHGFEHGALRGMHHG